MPGIARPVHPVCAHCLRARGRSSGNSSSSSLPHHAAIHRRISDRRAASTTASSPQQKNSKDESRPGQRKEPELEPESQPKPEPGAMARRLEAMSDDSLESGGRSARRAVEEAGFSEELRRKLEEKIASANFKSDNAGAFAQVGLPASARQGTRDIAAAAPWTGSESMEDTSLRMLTDAHKPLRGSSSNRSTPAMPGVRGPPAQIDAGRPRKQTGTGTRIADARDRSSIYAIAKDAGLSDDERAKFRQQMKQRFQPGARSLPATLQGLASLANERIEDAIARGQFKNLPRGQKIERDYNANSPFINTTEYFMNKMIQRQDIVPPWIEKQQEVVATANRFRSRLRADWRRHVSRVLASRGGSLDSQMRLAEEYAAAERLHNPSKRQVEHMNAVDEAGHVSQITIAGELQPDTTQDAQSADEQEEIRITEQPLHADGSAAAPEQQIKITVEQQARPDAGADADDAAAQPPPPPPPPPPPAQAHPSVSPFRDPSWEQTERSYHTLAIENLNSLTRSYNLMAPDLAKKPYFALDRELRACFADVAPQVAAAIKERALAPKIRGVEVIGHRPGSVLEKFSMDRASHVYDEQKPQYGFKEFWKDLFTAKT